MASDVKIRDRMTGASLVRYALEQLPIRFTFGIPGVHNTEIYDQLAESKKIRPILVTHEVGAAFMADAVSRTTRTQIGCLVIVPAAGLTHAMSGIAEAYLDGIPLLVISGGIRTDIAYGYQLHEIDQLRIADGITKSAVRVESHEEIVPAIFEAYQTAVSNVPGPVLVEIPANIALFKGRVGNVPAHPPKREPETWSRPELIDEAAKMLASAVNPGLFVGWGAVDMSEQLVEIAELLGAPVSTTLQGLSAFPGSHPLHAGMGFSAAAIPSATNAFKEVDTLLAVGTRFSEIPTGSFGVNVPDRLIHIDIDPKVSGRNYPAAVSICADANVVVPLLAARLRALDLDNDSRRRRVETQIAFDKSSFRADWYNHAQKSRDRVNPVDFFDELQQQLDDDCIVAVDDGNHTFLTAELLEIRGPRQFISPSDFNCMGYCVPAAIGAKLANPDRQVVGIVGDGAFLMTGLETLTASTERAGIVLFIFNDGELAQISQGQDKPYARKTATILGDVRFEGIAMAVDAKHLTIESDEQLPAFIKEALATATGGRPVIVDVKIDYSKQTRFTQGVTRTVFGRFSLAEKLRFVRRAFWRRMVSPQD